MNKFFNKAIFYKEFKIAKWFLFMLILEFTMFFYKGISRFLKHINVLMANSINDEVRRQILCDIEEILYWRHNGRYIFILLTIIVMAVVIVGRDRTNKGYETLGSMNFKREEIIMTKWITGVLTLLLFLLIIFVYIEIIWFSNKNLKFFGLTQGMLFQWFIINFLTFVFIYTFIVLIECLCGKEVLGGILGSIFLILPIGLIGLVFGFIDIITIKSHKFNDEVMMNIGSLVNTFAERATLSIYNMDYYKGNPGLRSFILLISIVVLVALIIIAFKNNDFEKNGYVSMFKPLEYVLKIGVSVCFGMLISIIILLNLISKEKNVYMPTIGIITFIISGIIVYFITHKLIEKSKA